MKRNRVLISLSVILPLLTGVAVAESDFSHRPRHGGPGHRLEQHLGELGLGAEQKGRVEEILSASRDARKENRVRTREASRKMHTLLEQEPPDEAAIMRQVEVMGALRTEGHKDLLRTLLAVRAELTPEQRQKLKEMKDEAGPRARLRHRRGADSDEE